MIRLSVVSFNDFLNTLKSIQENSVGQKINRKRAVKRRNRKRTKAISRDMFAIVCEGMNVSPDSYIDVIKSKSRIELSDVEAMDVGIVLDIVGTGETWIESDVFRLAHRAGFIERNGRARA